MDDYVLNEYVHVDHTEWADLGFYRVNYEPLEYDFVSSTLRGHIVLAETQERISFRYGSHVILVDSDRILDARIRIQGRLLSGPVPYLSMVWDRLPEDHFLTVSYMIRETGPPVSYIPDVPVRRVDWLKEGF
jgi:hypothetical protein